MFDPKTLLQKVLLYIGHLCLVVWTISFGKFAWKFSLNQDEKTKAQYDCATKNLLTSALNMDAFFRVSQYGCAKDMWDVL